MTWIWISEKSYCKLNKQKYQHNRSHKSLTYNMSRVWRGGEHQRQPFSCRKEREHQEPLDHFGSINRSSHLPLSSTLLVPVLFLRYQQGVGSGEKKEEKQRTELIIISFATNNNSKYLCIAYLLIGARCSLSANSSNSHDNSAIISLLQMKTPRHRKVKHVERLHVIQTRVVSLRAYPLVCYSKAQPEEDTAFGIKWLSNSFSHTHIGFHTTLQQGEFLLFP